MASLCVGMFNVPPPPPPKYLNEVTRVQQLLNHYTTASHFHRIKRHEQGTVNPWGFSGSLAEMTLIKTHLNLKSVNYTKERQINVLWL